MMDKYKSSLTPGRLNLITDVAGIRVGNAEDRSLLSGVTVVLPDTPVAAGVHIGGGAPGTRETVTLEPDCLVDGYHGFVLAGGSVFGLDAAGGVTSYLARRGTGFQFRKQPHPCPVIPAANLFDLTNGGDKNWGDTPPYRMLGIKACEAAGSHFELGNHGAGTGATCGTFKGGLGSASARWGDFSIGAVCALNCFGSPVNPATGDLWARPFELAGEFGNHTIAPVKSCDVHTHTKIDRVTGAGENTTLAIIAVDAALTKAQCKRLANMARDGMARAIRPVHTPYDGDVVFALSTGARPAGEPAALQLAMLGAVAGDVLARAIGRAVTAAESINGITAYRDAQ